MKKLAFAMYKPREGKAEELMDILKVHIPTLKEYDLITDKEPFTVLSENGTVIEIFEWASPEAIDLAHEHPAILRFCKHEGSSRGTERLPELRYPLLAVFCQSCPIRYLCPTF